MSHDFLLCFVVAVLAGLLGFFLRRPTSSDQARLARLEAKVNLLLDQSGIEPNIPIDDTGVRVAPPSSAIRDLILQGKKIDAIKVYRGQNPGVGLKDAKDAVEAIEAQLKAESYR